MLPMDDFDIEEMRLIPQEVEEAKKSKRERQTKPFVTVPVDEVIAAGASLGNPTLLLWLFLKHRAWKQGTNTIEVSNEAVKTWGLSRYAKRRALKAIVAAGLGTIEREGSRSPVVTLRR